MQLYVPKLTITTLPRSDYAVSGPELSQPTAPFNSGIAAGRWLCEKSTAPTSPATIAKTPILRLMNFLSTHEASALYQLLAAVDLDRCSGDRCGRHDVDRQGRNVSGPNHASVRQCW